MTFFQRPTNISIKINTTKEFATDSDHGHDRDGEKVESDDLVSSRLFERASDFPFFFFLSSILLMDVFVVLTVFRVHGWSFQGGSGSCLRILGGRSTWLPKYAVHTHERKYRSAILFGRIYQCIFGPRYR